MRKRLLILAACVLSNLMPSGAWAQEPSTQPATGEDRRSIRQVGPDGRPRPDRGYGERRGVGGGRWSQQVTEEEWQQISTFMKENFPKRWDVFVTIQGTQGKERLALDMRFRIIHRYRSLLGMQAMTPNVYEVAMQQARAEDDMWGAVRAWQDVADSQDTAARDAAREQLREKVKDVLRKALDDRKNRLENLQETIEREQKQLASDAQNIDTLVQTRVDQLTSDNPFGEPSAGPAMEGNETEAPR